MIEIVPFKANHLTDIELQDQQQYLANIMTVEQAEALEKTDWAYTAVDGDTVLGCAGVLSMWQGRGMCWAYLSEQARGSRFIHVHKAIKRFLDGIYIQRLEMTVDCDFTAGHRWAKMLGFHMEAERMEAYRPDGGACSLYARVL